MGYIAEFVEPSLATGARDAETDLYLSFFQAALADEIPPYFRSDYGESFRLHIMSPVWVIQCLISNSIKEGEGSRDLGSIADSCARRDLRSELVRHLEDEARHCRLYLRLIDIVFPGAVPRDLMDEMEDRLPPLVHRTSELAPLDDWLLLDNLIQINFGEIRTTLHQRLLEPVLHAYCPDYNRDRLARALTWLASDESRHVRYTAHRIGELGSADELAAKSLFVARSRDFSAYTERELGTQRDGLFAQECGPQFRDCSDVVAEVL
jgi:hypothetical protein